MKPDFFAPDNAPMHLRRLLELDQYLRRGRPGRTRAQLLHALRSVGFRVELRTFWRDIDRLRALGAPVHFDTVVNSETGVKETRWFYNKPSWTFSRIPMTEGTLFALLVSQRVMLQFAGLPVADELGRAFDEIADAFNRKIAIQHDTLVPISLSPEPPDPVKPEVWSQVAQAAMDHRRLKITYRKGWGNERGEVTVRNVAPYHIVNLQGTWYLLATASEQDDTLRQYALARIQKAKMLEHAFTVPADFDVDRLLSITFGQFIGDPRDVEEIHVRFKKTVAPLVMSRRFSVSEKKTVLSNGDIDLRFPASAAGPVPFYHIKSWVLSWGADAEVLAPESLKAIVRNERIRMAEMVRQSDLANRQSAQHCLQSGRYKHKENT
jgi:proteasome accessory factor B